MMQDDTRDNADGGAHDMRDAMDVMDAVDEGENVGREGENVETEGETVGRFLKRYLQVFEASCPRCQYNLHQLTGTTCPECGMGLVLTVGAVEPDLRAWITLVVSLCLGAGLGLFWIPVLLNQGMLDDDALGTIVCSIACIPLALLALCGRRRFIKMQPANQWKLTVCGVGLTVTAFVTFLAILP